ncbi:MAG TPA: class I SAM-dependent methyltransferase [Planctomycetaceae bacterium]|nr:class I SAM-dependent methyltransferase [Planctomycetaceae bacterium]
MVHSQSTLRNSLSQRNRRSAADGIRPAAALQSLLDRVCDGLRGCTIQELVDRHLDDLFIGLAALRRDGSPENWRDMLAECRRHPLLPLIHEDPLTRRAFTRPRGYAGDAVILDYIYGREELWPEPDATPIGRAIFRYTTGAPAAEGVRARRGFMAELIDRLAESVPHPHVLSIASGHLREANLAAAVRRRRLGRLVALDADAESLREVASCYGPYGVETCHADFRKLLAGRSGLGRFDLVYSTGLFDYLHHAAGRRLVTAMFNLLSPGGRLVVANFLPDIRDIGYMEAFMDWNLVYRTRHEMIELTRDVPQPKIHSLRIWAEEGQNIIFLEVCRR